MKWCIKSNSSNSPNVIHPIHLMRFIQFTSCDPSNSPLAIQTMNRTQFTECDSSKSPNVMKRFIWYDSSSWSINFSCFLFNTSHKFCSDVPTSWCFCESIFTNSQHFFMLKLSEFYSSLSLLPNKDKVIVAKCLWTEVVTNAWRRGVMQKQVLFNIHVWIKTRSGRGLYWKFVKLFWQEYSTFCLDLFLYSWGTQHGAFNHRPSLFCL